MVDAGERNKKFTSTLEKKSPSCQAVKIIQMRTTCVSVCVCARARARGREWVCVCLFVCVCVCVCVHVSMYVCMYICLFVFVSLFVCIFVIFRNSLLTFPVAQLDFYWSQGRINTTAGRNTKAKNVEITKSPCIWHKNLKFVDMFTCNVYFAAPRTIPPSCTPE